MYCEIISLNQFLKDKYIGKCFIDVNGIQNDFTHMKIKNISYNHNDELVLYFDTIPINHIFDYIVVSWDDKVTLFN